MPRRKSAPLHRLPQPSPSRPSKRPRTCAQLSSPPSPPSSSDDDDDNDLLPHAFPHYTLRVDASRQSILLQPVLRPASATTTTTTTVSLSSHHDAHSNNDNDNDNDKPDNSVAASEPIRRKPRYYTAAFVYVISAVLARYSSVLRAADIRVVEYLQNSLSDNALALFVRIYRRRNPSSWFPVTGLHQSYHPDISVLPAIDELNKSNLLHSSSTLLRNPAPSASCELAVQLLQSLSHVQLKQVSAAVVDAVRLRRLSKPQLLAALSNRLETPAANNPSSRRPLSSSGRRPMRQMTLTGLTPRQCLANSVVRIAGHCVSIPQDVVVVLQRVNLLYFPEDGHDSPNVMLADTGKIKFPKYRCNPSTLMFSSAAAYEAYLIAVQLETELETALQKTDLDDASRCGTLAETEVRHYMTALAGDDEANEDELMNEIQTQMSHPFLKRFTATWVYARVCWHSVHALERRGEFDDAITRLKLLLDTGLMAKRRGKCLNRLTINLYRNMKRGHEALRVIVDALQDEGRRLNVGDRVALAQRGRNIHKALMMTEAKTKGMSVNAARNAVRSTLETTCPDVISKVLAENCRDVCVRKIVGKSIQVGLRERRKAMSEVWNEWRRMNEDDYEVNNNKEDEHNSRDSSSMMGRAMFESRAGEGKEQVTVEQYCLEWYAKNGGWSGRHDEGGAIRMLYALLMWEDVLFADVNDVFQTPFQDRPLDIATETFYDSRKEAVTRRVAQLVEMSEEQLGKDVARRYDRFQGTKAVGCVWNHYSRQEMQIIAVGLGPAAVARCCQLLSEDYAYWAAGLPDLVLWTPTRCMLVEVKSPRDRLSDRQRAWLVQLADAGAACEVCRLVEN